MIKFSKDVERELRTQVIQAREVKPGVFGGYIIYFSSHCLTKRFINRNSRQPRKEGFVEKNVIKISI